MVGFLFKYFCNHYISTFGGWLYFSSIWLRLRQLWGSGPKIHFGLKLRTNYVGVKPLGSMQLKRTHDMALAIWLALISQSLRDGIGQSFVKKSWRTIGRSLATINTDIRKWNRKPQLKDGSSQTGCVNGSGVRYDRNKIKTADPALSGSTVSTYLQTDLEAGDKDGRRQNRKNQYLALENMLETKFHRQIYQFWSRIFGWS